MGGGAICEYGLKKYDVLHHLSKSGQDIKCCKSLRFTILLVHFMLMQRDFFLAVGTSGRHACLAGGSELSTHQMHS